MSAELRVEVAQDSLFLEVLYYAGGLKSKLYGKAGARHPHLPAPDRVGLHNDMFPATGQWVADFSRFSAADGTAQSGLTWIGLYTHAVDVYGDRGNFCGVGAWLLDGAVADHEKLLLVLQKLGEFIAGKIPRDGSSDLPALVDVNCEEALSYLREKCVIGRVADDSGLPCGGHHAAPCSYVVLGERGALAITGLAPILDVLALTKPNIKTPRILFAMGPEIEFDDKVVTAKRLPGFIGLLGTERPATMIAKRLIDLSHAREEAAESIKQELATAERMHQSKVAELVDEIRILKQQAESTEQKAVRADDWDTAPKILPHALPQPKGQQKSAQPQDAVVAQRLRAIDDKLHGIQLSISEISRKSRRVEPPEVAGPTDLSSAVKRLQATVRPHWGWLLTAVLIVVAGVAWQTGVFQTG